MGENGSDFKTKQWFDIFDKWPTLGIIIRSGLDSQIFHSPPVTLAILQWLQSLFLWYRYTDSEDPQCQSLRRTPMDARMGHGINRQSPIIIFSSDWHYPKNGPDELLKAWKTEKPERAWSGVSTSHSAIIVELQSFECNMHYLLMKISVLRYNILSGNRYGIYFEISGHPSELRDCALLRERPVLISTRGRGNSKILAHWKLAPPLSIDALKTCPLEVCALKFCPPQHDIGYKQYIFTRSFALSLIGN